MVKKEGFSVRDYMLVGLVSSLDSAKIVPYRACFFCGLENRCSVLVVCKSPWML